MDPEERQALRRAQRARERRRRAVRRQATAVTVLVAIVVIVIVILLTSGSGSPRSSSSPGATPSRPSGGAPLTSGAVSTKHSGQADASGASLVAADPRARGRGGSTAAALGPGTGRPGTAAVPVLMYHVIAPAPPNAPFPGLYVPASEFAAQMQALKSAGWQPVTLDQLRAYWMRGARLPPGKPIVLTFDNGYHSQYAAALPILQRLHWVADENIQLSGLPPSQGGLTSAQVRALIAAGWELDTQGISHADLITLNASGLHYQIVVARRRLRHEYGVPVNWFCYPSGHYDATVIAAVRSAGFIGSTTVVPGWAGPHTDPYTLPRLRVLGGTSPSALLAQIASARAGPPPPSSYGGA
ncbi:MAG: polysaccharide deacetylase family protein [Solirubrobacteraceae bacterium]